MTPTFAASPLPPSAATPVARPSRLHGVRSVALTILVEALRIGPMEN
jgi:hypothetical protein